MAAIDVDHELQGPADAPILLLSNSLGSTRAMWDAQMPALTRHLRVVRYDMRGHGASPVPPGPYELDDLGADALALLDRLDIRRAHVAGLSIGGLASMWLALHAASRVDRLALLATSARFEPASLFRERASLARREGTAALAQGVVGGRWLTEPFGQAHPEIVTRLQGMVAETPAEGYAGCCELLADTDLREEVTAIRAPTLVLAGAEDPSAPPDHSRRLAAAIPGARLEVLAGAAHLLNIEAPEAVSELLLEHFLG